MKSKRNAEFRSKDLIILAIRLTHSEEIPSAEVVIIIKEVKEVQPKVKTSFQHQNINIVLLPKAVPVNAEELKR